MKTKITYMIMATVLLISCNSKEKNNEKKLSSSNLNNTSKIKVDNLSNIEVYGSYNLKLSKNITDEVVIKSEIGTGDSVLIEKENDVYSIKINPKYKSINQTDITIYIPSNKLKSIQFYGSGSIKSADKLVNNDFNLELNGEFIVDLSFELEKLKFEKNGAGVYNLSGKVHNNIIVSNGAGTIDLQNLLSKTTTIDNSGAGVINVKASDDMRINNLGVGSVFVYGTTKRKVFNNVGVGKIVEVK